MLYSRQIITYKTRITSEVTYDIDESVALYTYLPVNYFSVHFRRPPFVKDLRGGREDFHKPGMTLRSIAEYVITL